MVTQDPNKKPSPAQDREDRLKTALKANMAKRKAQAKAKAKARTNAQHKDEDGTEINTTGKD